MNILYIYIYLYLYKIDILIYTYTHVCYFYLYVYIYILSRFLGFPIDPQAVPELPSEWSIDQIAGSDQLTASRATELSRHSLRGAERATLEHRAGGLENHRKTI